MRRALLALTLALFSGAACADRLALWHIVHDQCAAAKTPPCLEVGATDTLIKDRHGIAQVLAIPNARITGIEDPALLTAPTAYFADAWAARALMTPYLKAPPPREALSIAVNSAVSRSQDQLHLHVDCLKPEVAKALAEYAPHFDAQWRPMTVALAGRSYFARRVDSPDLQGIDPFRLLADEMPGAKADMGHWTLAAVPVRYNDAPGFVLLGDRAELTAGGHSEDIQDADCALTQRP